MTITERIAAAVKPIIDDHNRESRERIGQLERDINEARAHLEVARTTCERLTKQAPQTQQDGPWCIIGITAVGNTGRNITVVYNGDGAGSWPEDSGSIYVERSQAEHDVRALARRRENDEVECIRVATVAEFFAIYTRANGQVKP